MLLINLIPLLHLSTSGELNSCFPNTSWLVENQAIQEKINLLHAFRLFKNSAKFTQDSGGFHQPFDA